MRTPIPPDDAPLIVTAHLDEASFATLDSLRRRHFPPALNKVPAHVSLFHALPGAERSHIEAVIAQVCAPMEPFELWPAGPVSLGRGVALRYDSEALGRLHGELARRFAQWLTPQDRQRFKAHVTIQNKVEPSRARTLLARLDPGEAPVCRVEGLDLWRYLGGPWQPIATLRFGPPQ